MESTSFCKRYIDLMRYDKLHNSLPFLSFIAVFLIVVANVLVAVYIDHEDAERTLIALDDLILLFIMLFNAIRRNVRNDCRNLIELIEDEFDVDRREFDGREDKLMRLEKYLENNRIHLREVAKSISRFFAIICVLTVNKNMATYFFTSVDYEPTSWPTAQLTYHPPQFNSLLFFLYLYFLHGLLITIFVLDAFTIIILVCLSTEKILSDFQMLYTFLADLACDYADTDHLSNIMSSSGRDLTKQQVCLLKQSAYYLRKDMGRIVHCHQNLIKNFKTLVHNSEFEHSVIVVTMVLYSCTVAYSMLMSNDILKKVTFAAIFGIMNICMFLVFFNGQRIFNQNDVLRQTLAEVPWIDKPYWFKQTLHIMMTRAHIDFELRPFGIYILNYVAFKDVSIQYICICFIYAYEYIYIVSNTLKTSWFKCDLLVNFLTI
ncbi:hypothetical protein LSTR_LSTR014717 [Laodelphax striatellus]|uniref:Odorant receptor n=1 Tax=Laodelphax striatellus TaxID=195883 RepID=A0A482WML8_LAOST|nr:hypothetical protein LSTR_LSTR014717 [Laodelphax striatellus]